MNRIDLNKNWSISSNQTNEVFQADVPAMVLEVLYQNHKIPNPYVGENEWEAYEALKSDFLFSIPLQ